MPQNMFLCQWFGTFLTAQDVIDLFSLLSLLLLLLLLLLSLLLLLLERAIATHFR